MTDNTIKRVFLQKEVDTSIKAIKKGLSELQQISSSNDFYYAPILLLSSGLEKLMKCILCYYHMEINGRFPSGSHLREFGHDLWRLLQETIEICSQMNYDSSVATQQDIDFLSTDNQLHQIIQILSDFAKGGRYYNLDIVSGDDSDSMNPEDKWMELETYIANQKGWLNDIILKPTQYDESIVDINQVLIICIERFAHALSRIFTLSERGVEANRCHAYISDFLNLRDIEMGLKQY